MTQQHSWRTHCPKGRLSLASGEEGKKRGQPAVQCPLPSSAPRGLGPGGGAGWGLKGRRGPGGGVRWSLLGGCGRGSCSTAEAEQWKGAYIYHETEA